MGTGEAGEPRVDGWTPRAYGPGAVPAVAQEVERRRAERAVAERRRARRNRRLGLGVTAALVVAVAAVVAAGELGWVDAREGARAALDHDIQLAEPEPLRVYRPRAAGPETAGEDPFAARIGYPSVPEDVSPTPLGRPPAVPDDGRRAFLAQQPDGTPVAYDPCRPLRFVVNDRTAPAGADGILEEALDVVTAATGLRVVVEGPTEEPMDRLRPAVQPTRYGDRWAPILVAWSDPQEEPSLGGNVLGRGGSIPAQATAEGDLVYVTGLLALDGPDVDQLLRLEEGRALVRTIIVHELGHVLGLDHVGDADQVMYPEADRAKDLGPGDAAGLAALGAGRCYPDV